MISSSRTDLISRSSKLQMNPDVWIGSWIRKQWVQSGKRKGTNVCVSIKHCFHRQLKNWTSTFWGMKVHLHYVLRDDLDRLINSEKTNKQNYPVLFSVYSRPLCKDWLVLTPKQSTDWTREFRVCEQILICITNYMVWYDGKKMFNSCLYWCYDIML